MPKSERNRGGRKPKNRRGPVGSEVGVCSGCVRKPVIATIVQKSKLSRSLCESKVRLVKSMPWLCGFVEPFSDTGSDHHGSLVSIGVIRGDCKALFLMCLCLVTTFYTFMLSTGSCRANVHNSGLSKQIGAFCVIRLTMILNAYPIPPVVNQARRSVRGGPHTGQMPLCEAETALSTFLNGRGSCEVPCHKTGVIPGSAA
jgi:hypothetical protein